MLLFGPYQLLRLVASLLTVAALALGIYVALDQDLRTLLWSKWTGEVPYAWPGGERHITIKIGVEGKETEIQVPRP